MRKTLQKVMSFYLFLFLLPILTIKLPMLAFGTTTNEQVETRPVAYAANVTKEITNEQTKEISMETNEKPLNVLLYFTHIQESYQPIVEKELGLKAVNYHPTNNISNVSDLVTQHFLLNGDTVDVLSFDKMNQMKIKGAYSTIRPQLVQQMSKKEYDVILDLHRDSLKKDRTTLVTDGTTYAKLTFVVGAEHANYKLNEAFAKAVSDEVNRMVPSISKGVYKKTHDDGNGIYNQDLSSSSLLVELGGIENTEEEVNRTIAILTKAISNVFGKTNAS
ncbi:stage II sporulation protein P [Paenisporosarcina indica]|uniref:stage II sporulation protein P n=1 Tax=Paenisporosarcina indica TaxID=650093 RepID=UPI00094FCCAD|nr:stage II sporulation protein P [Paenisporosarcina indica]